MQDPEAKYPSPVLPVGAFRWERAYPEDPETHLVAHLQIGHARFVATAVPAGSERYHGWLDALFNSLAPANTTSWPAIKIHENEYYVVIAPKGV
jgi:hypothetical protein